MRKPSEGVQIRTLRRDLAAANERANTAMGAQQHWRQRATKAEQDAVEWKARFDRLLDKLQVVDATRTPQA